MRRLTTTIEDLLQPDPAARPDGARQVEDALLDEATGRGFGPRTTLAVATAVVTLAAAAGLWLGGGPPRGSGGARQVQDQPCNAPSAMAVTGWIACLSPVEAPDRILLFEPGTGQRRSIEAVLDDGALVETLILPDGTQVAYVNRAGGRTVFASSTSVPVATSSSRRCQSTGAQPQFGNGSPARRP
jgi:hypothetical protein